MSVKDFSKKLLILLLALALYSRFGPSLPISVVTQDKGLPLVVEGEGKAIAKPDSAKVNVGIEEEGESLEEVQETASQKSQALVSSIKALGIDEDDIKTTSYNVFPQYSYEGETPQITGYRVSTSYEVKVEDVELVNRLLTTATANGANVVGGVVFEVSDEERNRLLDEARKEAADMAEQKAQSLAKAAGVKLGKVLSITESEAGSEPPIALLERDAAITIEPTAPEITPGETEVKVTVTISYEIR